MPASEEVIVASLLPIRRYGSGPPLVALHGFTLTGAQFAGLAAHLDRAVLAPDLPGHGGAADVAPDVGQAIAALAAMLGQLEPPVPVLGYSMGGRLALSLALDHPRLVSRAVVVSAGSGIEDDDARALRAAEDAALAEHLRDAGMKRFLDEWLSSPVTSTQGVAEAARRADRLVREENSPRGLGAALIGFGQGSYPFLGDRLGGLTVPLLAVSGSKDHRYGDRAAELAATVPDGRHVVIHGAGHNVILEAPVELAAVIGEFLTG